MLPSQLQWPLREEACAISRPGVVFKSSIDCLFLQAIESRLGTKLPDDLPAALADGVVLCHLVNHVKKSTIPVIHVPSGGMVCCHLSVCLHFKYSEKAFV